MPEYKSQLGNLLPLLAQLKQGGLARVLAQQIGDVAEGSAVILGDVLEPGILDMGSGRDSHVGRSIIV